MSIARNDAPRLRLAGTRIGNSGWETCNSVATKPINRTTPTARVISVTAAPQPSDLGAVEAEHEREQADGDRADARQVDLGVAVLINDILQQHKPADDRDHREHHIHVHGEAPVEQLSQGTAEQQPDRRA